MLTLTIYMLAGVFVGLGSGLFGIGGGMIAVPVLLPIFAAQGMDPDVAMHLAIGSSMSTIVVTGMSSARAHHRLGNIHWDALPWLGLGLGGGALSGAQIAGLLGGDELRVVFGACALLLAVRMFFGGQPRPAAILPPRLLVVTVGFAIGAVSSLVGIGGGAFLVPFLAWMGLQMREAVGTSAAGGVCIAAAGSLGFILAGTGDEHLPPLSTGYVYWPAVGGITLASVFLAPVGAKLASRLSPLMLRRAFAIFLIVLGLRLLLSG